MGIKLKTEEGAEFSFDTVAEFMEFKKQIDAEEASKETESAIEEDASEDVEEPLGKDANGEDLYKGDFVTGTEDNDYGYTNSTVDMEVMGKGSSILDEEANIRVRILGESSTYGVDSSKFVKLSDNHAEDEHEFHTGDIVKATESFTDIFGDRVSCGAVYNYDENLLYGEPFVGTVFLGDNKDKIELVCRADDRLDI